MITYKAVITLDAEEHACLRSWRDRLVSVVSPLEPEDWSLERSQMIGLLETILIACVEISS